MALKTPMLMGDGLRRNASKFPLKIAATDRLRPLPGLARCGLPQRLAPRCAAVAVSSDVALPEVWTHAGHDD